MSEISTELQTSVELAKERSHEAADKTSRVYLLVAMAAH